VINSLTSLSLYKFLSTWIFLTFITSIILISIFIFGDSLRFINSRRFRLISFIILRYITSIILRGISDNFYSIYLYYLLYFNSRSFLRIHNVFFDSRSFLRINNILRILLFGIILSFNSGGTIFFLSWAYGDFLLWF